MKKVRRITAVLLGLAISVGVYAQNTGNSNLPCLNTISGLTEQQKEKIAALEKSHQEQMAEFRAERRGTTDSKIKTEVYDKMQLAKASHQKEVLGLLNDDQKSQYLNLHANGQGQFYNRKNARCVGAGNGVQQGKGNGNFRGGKKGNCQGTGRMSGGKGKYRSGNNNQI